MTTAQPDQSLKRHKTQRSREVEDESNFNSDRIDAPIDLPTPRTQIRTPSGVGDELFLEIKARENTLAHESEYTNPKMHPSTCNTMKVLSSYVV
jgi:hypothetical protein